MKLNLARAITVAAITLADCQGQNQNQESLQKRESPGASSVVIPRQNIQGIGVSIRAQCIELGQLNGPEFKQFQRDGRVNESMIEAARRSYQECLINNGLMNEDFQDASSGDIDDRSSHSTSR
ncbi:MAG: hypothetical protein NTX63_00370 [Candidatus Peregrinibacteria bacterium]|nr:hypothetical protein [Candidatus Peregrinibacteria bacterium]